MFCNSLLFTSLLNQNVACSLSLQLVPSVDFTCCHFVLFFLLWLGASESENDQSSWPRNPPCCVDQVRFLKVRIQPIVSNIHNENNIVTVLFRTADSMERHMRLGLNTDILNHSNTNQSNLRHILGVTL